MDGTGVNIWCIYNIVRNFSVREIQQAVISAGVSTLTASTMVVQETPVGLCSLTQIMKTSALMKVTWVSTQSINIPMA